MIEFFTSLFQGISLAHLNALLILGLALFGGTIGGRLFQKLKIPQVVGYIAIGILIGQTGFSLVPPETVRQFQPFSYFALGLISFMIGGELKFTTLRKYGRQFFSILFMEALGAFFFVGIIVSIIAYLLLQNPVQAVLTGLLLGSIAAATAPAATTDVLWEYRTRGPLTSTVFGIVALDDILALLLFAVSSSVATAFLGQGGGMAGELGNLAWEVGGALVIGGGSGFLLSQLLKVFRDEDKTLTFGLGAILLTLGLATTLKVDMLLSSMTMGILITNIAPRRSEEVFHLLRRVSTPIYVLFFVLVGASLNIGAISPTVAMVVAAYLLGRTAGKTVGARLGAHLSRATMAVRKYLPFCLFSQAGVAIGLSILAGQKFPGPIGDTIILVITATTFIVQLLGPPFVKYAATRAGEAGLNVTEEDIIKDRKVRDVVSADSVLIREDTNLRKILAAFSRSESLSFPVVDGDGRLLGVISIRSIKETFQATELSEFLLAHDLMEPATETAGLETPLSEADEKLRRFRLDYLPVVTAEGKVAGMLERTGIERFVATHLLALEQRTAALE